MPRFSALSVLVTAIVAASHWNGAAGAFDCKKAASETERLICADAGLKQADDDLQTAWRRLRKVLEPDVFSALQDSQRAWLELRERRCGHGKKPQRVACLAKLTRERTLILAARPRTGPQTHGAFRPFAVFRPGDKRSYEIDIVGVEVANPKLPGEVAFNAAVSQAEAYSELYRTQDFDAPGQLTYMETIALEYAGPNLISAVSRVWRYDGGAHGNSGTTGLNFSRRHGKLSFAMIFAESATKELSAMCRQELRQRGADKVLTGSQRRQMLFEDTDAAIAETLDDLDIWTFDAGGAVVHFSPYAIAPYAAGAFECRLELAAVRALASDTRHLPQ